MSPGSGVSAGVGLQSHETGLSCRPCSRLVRIMGLQHLGAKLAARLDQPRDPSRPRPSQLLDAVLATGRKGLSIQLCKGLGEMNAERRWETTFGPQARSMRRVASRPSRAPSPQPARRLAPQWSLALCRRLFSPRGGPARVDSRLGGAGHRQARAHPRRRPWRRLDRAVRDPAGVNSPLGMLIRLAKSTSAIPDLTVERLMEAIRAVALRGIDDRSGRHRRQVRSNVDSPGTTNADAVIKPHSIGRSPPPTWRPTSATNASNRSRPTARAAASASGSGAVTVS